MPLFARLNERELLRVMQVAEVIGYAAGEEVVREGDRGDELFLVLAGQVRIHKGETNLLEIGPGDHFGEMALIRAAPRSATATAVEASELIAMKRSDFFEILRKEHELAVKLLWQFLGVLADRLDQTSSALSTARQELAAEDISDAIFPDNEEPPQSEPGSDEGPPPLSGSPTVLAALPDLLAPVGPVTASPHPAVAEPVTSESAEAAGAEQAGGS
jgi:hypothetical protein